MQKQLYWVLGGIAIALIAFFMLRPAPPVAVPPPIYVHGKADTTIVHDTVKVNVYIKSKPKPIEAPADSFVVQADTTLTKDSSSVKLHVEYDRKDSAFTIQGSFDVRNSVIKQTDTLKTFVPFEVERSRAWYQRIHITAGPGVTYVNDKLQILPFLGVTYELF